MLLVRRVTGDRGTWAFAPRPFHCYLKSPCTPAVTHLERGDNVQSNRVPSSHPGGKERWAGWAGQL